MTGSSDKNNQLLLLQQVLRAESGPAKANGGNVPVTVLGTGIRYLGKVAPWIRANKCPLCGVQGQLTSYTASKYVVVFWAALVPLSKVRIEDECRACGQHRISTLTAWQARGDEELDERSQALENNPEDPAVVEAFLDSVQVFCAREDFDSEAEDLCERFSSDAQVLGRLGEAFSFFCQFERADACLRAAQAVQDSLTLQCRIALNLLRQARPAEAEPKLDPILSGRVEELRWYLYLLVEGYQSCGAHAQAAAVLAKIAASWPAQPVEPEHKWYANSVGRYLKGRKRLPSLYLERSKPARPFFGQRMVQGTLSPLLLVYAGLTLSMGQSRPIFLVNGLDTPYEVEILGIRHRLLPGAAEPLNVPEGPVEYKVVSEHSPVASGSVKVETFWLSRAFQSKTFVVNPDQMAVLITERMRYTKHPDESPYASEYKLSSGRNLYEFEDVDLLFQEFPKDISVVEGEFDQFFDRPTFTRRLGALSVPVAERLKFIGRNLGPDETKTYLQRCLDLSPSLEALEAARAELGPDVLLGLATPHLDRSPTQTYWHLLYQEVAWRGRDLEAEYRRRLGRSPEDAELQFLLGRVVHDAEESRALFRRCTVGQHPSQFGLLALVNDSISAGDFAAAERLCGANSGAVPPLLHDAYVSALWGQGRYSELLGLNFLEITDSERALILVSAGRPDEARKLVDAAPAGKAKYLSMELNYAEGEKSTPQDYDADLQAYADLLDGKIDQVIAEVSQVESWPIHLSLFLMASAQKQKSAAAAELKRSVDLLAASRPFSSEARAGHLLEHPGRPQETLSLRLQYNEKRIFLAAMALRDPAHQESYCKLARRLNFDRSFPYWTVEKIVH